MPGIEDQAAAALHVVGLILTGLLGRRLWSRALRAGIDPPRRQAVRLFIASWFVLYTASVAFHLAPAGDVRTILMALDQGAIFILIAAGWAPLAPFRMAPGQGRHMLIILWGLAALGIAVELWAAVSEQHPRLHALGFGLYLLQAAVPIMVFGRGLWRRLSRMSLGWLAGSMAAYSIGLMFYQRTGMPWSHVAWHFAILVGCVGNFHGVRQLVREDAVLSGLAGQRKAYGSAG